ncbi:hypothetical protein [Propionivibrio sp.]|uniref:hypothetical protein n=1 Tax=Propionivibrio sp. TaxID=2212460 RepID=UPI002621714B|nr:hypothetical protein [Propionivibrio sp.]
MADDPSATNPHFRITGYVWDYLAENAAPKAAAVNTAQLPAVPKLDARTFQWPAPQYVAVRIEDVDIEFPAVPENPQSNDFERTGVFQQMQRLAGLAFATGGTQRILSFELQLALICAAFSAPEMRRQYLPPGWNVRSNPFDLLSSLSVPNSLFRMPSFARKNLSDALLNNESLRYFRRQVFPPQADYSAPSLDTAALKLAQRTLRAWQNAVRQEARARCKKIAAIEIATREAGLERMRASMDQAALWLTVYSTLDQSSTQSAIAMLANKKMPPIIINTAKPLVQDLQNRMAAMRPAALEVKKAYEQLKSLFSVMGAYGAPDLQKEMQRILGPSMARYSAEIGVHALHHPILFRTPPDVLLEALDHGLAHFSKPLGLLLHRLYQSAQHMLYLLERISPQANQISFNDAGGLTDVDVEARLAGALIDNDLLWRHPSLIHAGLVRLQEDQADENLKLASDVLEALAPLRQQKARNQMGLAIVETVGLVAADILLTAIAPPLGAAFGVAVSGKGVYDAIEDYDQSVAPYFCTLDPGLALSEQSPDTSAIALSVAFAALDIAPVLRGVKKVMQ